MAQLKSFIIQIILKVLLGIIIVLIINYCLFHYISVCVNALPQLVNTNKIRTNHLLLLLPVFQRAGIL